MELKAILHPTDFSEYSEAAFKIACSLAKDYGAKIIVMHVHTPPEVVYGEFGAAPPVTEEDTEALKERLFAIKPSDSSISVEHFLVQGDPVEEILRFAKEKPCDLIVMGTHGRTGLGRLLMGSVAEQVVRKSPRPVLTVKTPIPDEGKK